MRHRRRTPQLPPAGEHRGAQDISVWPARSVELHGHRDSGVCGHVRVRGEIEKRAQQRNGSKAVGDRGSLKSAPIRPEATPVRNHISQSGRRRSRSGVMGRPATANICFSSPGSVSAAART